MEANTSAWHGNLGDKDWAEPEQVVSCESAVRPDQKNTMRADEFVDTPAVLAAKVRLLANLLRKSRVTTAYAGAGLSTASGVNDYASKSKDSLSTTRIRLKSPLHAQPTKAHRALVLLNRAGLLQYVVGQNHDGLCQKAGFPENAINEIHGAWYAPCNPVVQFDGSLRDDLFHWMLDIEKATDLCLTMGTSLSGMNADRCAETPARRQARGKALGTVIINLQRTRLDDQSCLRIWAKLDDVFVALVQELGIEWVEFEPEQPVRQVRGGDVFWIPYTADGARLPEADMARARRGHKVRMMRLDLRKGAPLRVGHAAASNHGVEGRSLGRDDMGHFAVLLQFQRRMGSWWVAQAQRGDVLRIPVQNVDPQFAMRRLPGVAKAKSSHKAKAKAKATAEGKHDMVTDNAVVVSCE